MVIGILACFFSPRLYRIYNRANLNAELYQMNWAEQWGDFAVGYLTPVGLMYSVWHRRLHYFLYLAILVITSYMIRAAGRMTNPHYSVFLQALKKAQQAFNTENAEILRGYDFEFGSWPESFSTEAVSNYSNRTHTSKLNPSWWIGWGIAHTFGIRLIYPGLLFGSMIRAPLEDARGKLVLEQRGQRSKIKTGDGNSIDTMFFDRRSETNTNGRTLVICCEGNAGFYEIGMLVTPLSEGFSVLGWNHPGFGGSTGVPYPNSELNAAEAVFEYARSLGFRDDEILLYAWSIGGFPAAYLASQHHHVKGVILDATFDDILPLALPRMPAFMSPLVRSTIRNHVNLRVGHELRGYAGPLRLIRRTEDEIIADPPGVLSANRGNWLILDVIRTRFPGLFDDRGDSETALADWLSKSHATESSSAPTLRQNSDLSIPNDLPSLSSREKSQLALMIAEKLVTDYKSTHCVPLTPNLFLMPWRGPTSNQNY